MHVLACDASMWHKISCSISFDHALANIMAKRRKLFLEDGSFDIPQTTLRRHRQSTPIDNEEVSLEFDFDFGKPKKNARQQQLM